ncbi:MAG: SDR family oxidoreductase [Candidatus Marinimicrobia bacterium]|jgi:NAD(P)-dependent dehydrogenase (short-subunit alcohol dehydrogenase family)|nr:SDR family oxidoreductase [Candidatus Neomarinimicrobiota bacterium]MBT7899862.1 SDR family oxidoreductase [Candidatus Neomarinimicrobiota bacterium]
MNGLVLIIGGTSGIGLETANYLLNKDYEVIICGRREIKSKDLNSIRVNVKSDESVKELFKKVQNNFRDINSLVYSAGITSPKKSIVDFDEKIWHDVFDTNVTGLLRVLKYFFPSLKETKGSVTVINSIAARSFSQFSGVEYTISKAALSGLVKQLASEWIDDGVFINSVYPSMTLTPMLKENLGIDQIKKLNEELPLKKLAKPFDIARAIEFLISKENKYITGSGIDVSGGQFLNG